MNCTHPANDLLSDFFSNTLPPDKHAEVRRHVKECAVCRESLAVMTILNVGAVSPSDSESAHVGGDLLARFVHDPKSLEQSTFARIQHHLSTCEDCSYEHAFLTELSIDLEKLAKNSSAQESLFERAMSAILSPMKIAIKSPVVAYFLLALTVYPAIRWIADEMKKGDKIATKPVLLREMTRSQGDLAIVTRHSREDLVVLELPLTISAASVTHSVSLLPLDGREELPVAVYSKVSNHLEVLFQASLLDDGNYVAKVILISRLEPPDTLTHSFPFTLTTK